MMEDEITDATLEGPFRAELNTLKQVARQRGDVAVLLQAADEIAKLRQAAIRACNAQEELTMLE